MIDFAQAINVATDNVHKLVPRAEDITTEGAIISDDGKLYEVTLSYELKGPDFSDMKNVNNMWALAQLMSKRREQKIFLIDASSGTFRGFKNISSR